MKKLSGIFFLFVTTLLMVATACSAQVAIDPIKDRQDVINLVKDLYKIKPTIYYSANFGGLKFDIKKQEDILRSFYLDNFFVKRNSSGRIDPKGEIIFPDLYPVAHDPNEDIQDLQNRIFPKLKIESPEFNNHQAKLIVKISDGSLVQFFLQKRPEGWRIYKARTFTHALKDLYYLVGQENEREAYGGTMREYPDTPEAPHFDSSDKPSLKLSPW